jgi:hypothetical protein
LFKSKFAPIFVNKLKGNNNLLDKYVNSADTATVTDNNTSDIKHNNLHLHQTITNNTQGNDKLNEETEAEYILRQVNMAKKLGLFYGFED